MSGTDKEVKNFLSALAGPSDLAPPAKVTRGEVIQDNLNGTVDVVVGAGTNEVEMAYMDSYSPTVGDEVIILVFGVDRVVLGKLA